MTKTTEGLAASKTLMLLVSSLVRSMMAAGAGGSAAVARLSEGRVVSLDSGKTKKSVTIVTAMKPNENRTTAFPF